MQSRSLRAAAFAAALPVLWGSPALAQSETEPAPEAELETTAPAIPAEPLKLYLKDHPDLPLDADGDALRLSGDHDLWTLQRIDPGPAEALIDLGEYLIVHEGTGRCLTADTASGEEVVPTVLGDCADATAWRLVFDDRTNFQDFRFTTADGYFLGLADDVQAEEGVSINAVLPETGRSHHFQEWLFALAPEDAPSTAPEEAAPSPEPAPKLPTTGLAFGAAAGVGAFALAAGAVLVLWWQRRRVLRSDW